MGCLGLLETSPVWETAATVPCTGWGGGAGARDLFSLAD